MRILPGDPRRERDALVADVDGVDAEREGAHHIDECEEDEPQVATDAHGGVGGDELVELCTAHPEGAQSHCCRRCQ